MRKGQYTILEQVVLFALGISITIGFMFAFKDLSSGVSADMKDVQSGLVAEYVASTSIELVKSGAEGSVQMPVPERIASESYVVTMEEGVVRVQVSGERSVSTMYGLGSTTELSGGAESREGALELSLDGNELELSEGE